MVFKAYAPRTFEKYSAAKSSFQRCANISAIAFKSNTLNLFFSPNTLLGVFTERPQPISMQSFCHAAAAENLNMAEFKILITSQKGGVGKSTVSANLAAYLCKQGHQVALLDFDLHGSSSKWLEGAPPIGIGVHHEPLPLEIGGTRPVLEAKQKLQRLCYTHDIVICDLTWSDSMTADLLFEYDLVIVPTSVSEIELNATSDFLERFRWVFESTLHAPPKLLLSPTRVHNEQVSDTSLFKQHFPFRLILAPAILEGQSARQLYKRGYLCDLDDACGVSFNEFGSAVAQAMALIQQDKAKREDNNSRMRALLKLAAQYEASIKSVFR